MIYEEKFHATEVILQKGSATAGRRTTSLVHSYEQAVDDGKDKTNTYGGWDAFKVEKVFVPRDEEDFG